MKSLKSLKSLLIVGLLAAGCSTGPMYVPNLTPEQEAQLSPEEYREYKEAKAQQEAYRQRQAAQESGASASREEVRSEEAAVLEHQQVEGAQGPAPDEMVRMEASAGEEAGEHWEWDLEVGQELDLRFESTTDVEMKLGGQMGAMMGGMMGGDMMGEAMTDRIEMMTAMTMKVVGMAEDGRYDLEFHVDEMEIRSRQGGRTTLEELPEEVRVLRAWMNRRGTVEFYERVLVEITEKGPTAVMRIEMNADGTSASSSASADGVTVSSSASIDPETGQVTLRGEVREEETTQQKRTRTVEEERPVQHMDVLPVQVLSLLELPEGAISAGDRFEAEFPSGVVVTTAEEKQQCEMSECGRLRMEMEVDSQEMMDSSRSVAEADGFEFDAEDEAAMGMMPTTKSKVDATMLFNIEEGRIYMIEGSYGSTSGAQGMEIEESTTFTFFM